VGNRSFPRWLHAPLAFRQGLEGNAGGTGVTPSTSETNGVGGLPWKIRGPPPGANPNCLNRDCLTVPPRDPIAGNRPWQRAGQWSLIRSVWSKAPLTI